MIPGHRHLHALSQSGISKEHIKKSVLQLRYAVANVKPNLLGYQVLGSRASR